MSRLIDLTGQRFGKLTVIKRAENKNNRTMWLCVCECGNESIVWADDLKHGKIVSCGCYKQQKTTDLTGQEFGRLTVLKRVENDKYGKSQWLCKCNCNSENSLKIVLSRHLKSGVTQSCGCLQREAIHLFKDLTGEKFGRWTVIKRVENNKWEQLMWLCECECGNRKIIIGESLKSGNTQSCGCSPPSNYIDLTGQAFGRLIIIKRVDDGDNWQPRWLCQCSCENKTVVAGSSLRNGVTQSCGCLQREIARSIIGSNHPQWKGTTRIYAYLRNNIKIWKYDSMKNCYYKCIISNEKINWDIHHLYSFSKIVDETIKLSGLPIYEEINLYTNEELKLLIDICLELHYKYGLGVCISKELHYEFHSIYGRKNFTPEDFYEFYKFKTGKNFNSSFLMVNFIKREVM